MQHELVAMRNSGACQLFLVDLHRGLGGAWLCVGFSFDLFG